jgi:HAD superfamily hydrolase (TIGR01549 family)
MKTNMKITAVIFDVDDTLFDRELAQNKALEMLVDRFPQVLGGFTKERLKISWQESDRIAMTDFEASATSTKLRDTRSKEFIRFLGIQEDLADAFTQAYLRDYPSINTPVPGAADLLKDLSLKYKLGVISNSLPDVQYRKLETLGFRNMFSCIVLSEELGIRKPDPRIFRHAAYLLQVPTSNCLYVGNSFKADIIGAKTAGMQACWYKHDNSIQIETNIRADFEINKLEELEEILR